MLEGWLCPKCGYVWAWWIAGCSNCNQAKTISAFSAFSTNVHYCRMGISKQGVPQWMNWFPSIEGQTLINMAEKIFEAIVQRWYDEKKAKRLPQKR